jgi:nucleoside-specific outer membrane channel protein Tsx
MKRIHSLVRIAALFAFSAVNYSLGQGAPNPTTATHENQKPHLFLDDSLFMGYGPNYETPFVMEPGQPHAAKIPRTTIEYRHVDSWRLGDNFIDISLRKSSSVEPAAGGGTGALEPYAIFRSSLSYNKLTKSRALSFGPIRDLSFEFGANLETKNSSYSPEERTIYIGPMLQMKVPRGFLNVGFHYRKEWNHEAVLGKDESYSPDFNVEPTWAIPFAIHRVALTFDGFADVNTPKGEDSFGAPTHTEFITRPLLWLDLGSLARRKPRVLEIGVGLEYWNNEYGKSATTVPGTSELTPLFQLKVHLPGGGMRR